MTWLASVSSRRLRSLQQGPSDGGPVLAAGEALAVVAARLRAGADPARAWLGITIDDDGGLAATTVRAAERLARELGAPLAEVLDEVGAGVADDEAAAADRRIAIAGPATTARVLAWLPAAGLLLGLALGADLVAIALDGGIGSASVVVGPALLGAGRAWTRLLVRAAELS